MTIIQSAILGLIEGITEFLPISSTAHLTLSSGLIGLDQSAFVKSFEIIIQLGAILAVIILYWRTLLVYENFKKIIIAFLPTGAVGYVLYKIVKTYLLGNETIIVWTLLLGGLFLIFFEKYRGEKESASADFSQISYKQCLIIGLCQSLAMVPGVSRSAATIVSGLALGISRKTIVEFSFLLAVPTMLAASAYDFLKNADSFSNNELSTLAVGFIVSFGAAIISIKFLLKYVRNHSFIPFGVYRIAIALLFMYLLIV